MANSRRFQGKVVIVTGGGLGIGRETALQFAQEGAFVAIPDIDVGNAKETQTLIADKGGHALPLKVDVSNADDVKKMVELVREEFGRIDILVNNAATGVRDNLLKAREEDWDRTIAVDLRGVFLCIKYVSPEMIKTGGGKIVNMASLTGLIGLGVPAYTAAKGGVISLTRLAAGELAPHRINVNAICPGFIATRMNEPLRNSPIGETLKKRIPWGRFGEPADVAALILFLASGQADYITGAIIPIDGGLGSYLDLGQEYRTPGQ
jgi:NAD(P)-dependent dehydrogenase (short-subunit alcohol dehydrogenase family)